MLKRQINVNKKTQPEMKTQIQGFTFFCNLLFGFLVCNFSTARLFTGFPMKLVTTGMPFGIMTITSEDKLETI